MCLVRNRHSTPASRQGAPFELAGAGSSPCPPTASWVFKRCWFAPQTRLETFSEYLPKAQLQVLTPEQAAAKVEAQAKTIEGTVIFRDAPVPNAVVKLLGPEMRQVAAARPARTDNSRSPNVPVGKFQISTEGVINDVPRFGGQPVIVELAPGPVVRADIRLE